MRNADTCLQAASDMSASGPVDDTGNVVPAEETSEPLPAPGPKFLATEQEITHLSVRLPSPLFFVPSLSVFGSAVVAAS